MSSSVLDDSRNPRNVADGVVEQNEVHHGVDLVVLDERVLKRVLDVFNVRDLVVLHVVAGGEVAEDERVGALGEIKLARVELGKGLFGLLRHDVLELQEPLGVDDPVAVDTLALVEPQKAELLGVVKIGRGRDQQTSEDIGQVPNVELVVEVGGRLPEGVGDLLVHRERALDQGRRAGDKGAVEVVVRQVAREECVVDRQE
mmetsp:Transcript_25698/g.48312  ORF Transcript_25698/g.48312 Transcript_25698/m.48312 type:complete len:201 (-) Transcript_25698:136-738(-)